MATNASESTLDRLLKGLPAVDDAGKAAGDTGMMKVLQQLLATQGEGTTKPKPNPVEKALSMDVRTLVVRALLAYPVLRMAVADPELRVLMIAELVPLSL